MDRKNLYKIFTITLVLIFSLSLCGCAALNFRHEYDKGMRFYNEKKYDEAIVSFNNALNYKPDSYSALCLLGTSYAYKNDDKMAEKTFQDAINLFPDEWNAYVFLGDLKRSRHDYDLAVEYYETAVSLPSMGGKEKTYYKRLLKEIKSEQAGYNMRYSDAIKQARAEGKEGIVNTYTDKNKEPEQQKQIVNFDIEEQRIIDFENLLNHIIKVSRNYRTDVEKALSRFIINYKIIKNAQYLQNDFDNITNNYLDIYKSVIKKFEKDESIEALQVRINNEEQNIKNIENKLLTNNIAINEMQRQMQELTKIYFVGGYVRKLLSQVDVLQEDSNVKNQNINENVSQLSKKVEKDNGQEVFKKIKKLAYDKRMNHIIEISKWTKNIEEKLKFFHLEESDFQFVIYMIRQTESECNANFEQVANMIIRLCDANLQLEQIEENEKVKNKELQKEIDTTQILKDGIENIKKKYSKIPFIGRKVTSILSAKMLNE